MNRPQILITHPWMGRGGSEATAMWTLEALQDDFEVTFVTASPMDWEELNGMFGTSVRPEAIRFVRAPRLPTVNSAFRLALLQGRCFERFCRKMAQDFDLCISAYNPVQFGKPGMQLIGDFSFSEEMRKRLYIYGDDKFCHRETPLRKFYLGLVNFVSSQQVPLRERGDLVLANSEWSAVQLAEYFEVKDSPVIYPPVVLPSAPADSVRDPFGFVCLGRVVPEKEVERIIRILERVRGEGYPVTLRLIGELDESAYSARIRSLVSQHDWITPEGFLQLEAKQDILASQTYALHACRIEAFGIAVAEMASMGCIPIVPKTGGAGEIVPLDELQFESDDEACAKIIRLLKRPELVPDLREKLSSRVSRFGPQVFKEELRGHLQRFAGLKNPSLHADSEQNLATAH